MTDQAWWQRKLPRPRPVQPQRLPPFNQPETQPLVDQPNVAAPPIMPQAGLPMPAPMAQPIESAPPRTDSQEDLDYAQLMSPPKKANKFLDALYVGAQGLANILDTEGNYQPIERLGDTKKRQKDEQAMRRIQVRNMRQKAEQEVALRKAQERNIYEDNKRARDDLERKATKDTAQIKYWERKADQGDWKLINDEKLMDLRDKWAESKDVNDKRRLDLVEKEMTYRNVRSKLDRESRERIAGWRESGLNRRQQLAAEAKQLLTQFQEAQKNNRAEEQRALQERLAEIRAEAQANP